MTAPQRLLRLPQVKEMTGLARSTIYHLISNGKFPPPVRVSARAVAWRESEIAGWQAGLTETGGGK